MTPAIDLEMALLLACIRAALGADPTPPPAAEKLSHSNSAVDLDRLLGLATRHNVLPIVRRGIERLGTRAPAALRDALRDAAFRELARNMAMTEQLGRALAALERRGIRALAYKGPAMAAQVWSDPSARSFVDLDLLVLPHEFNRARAALAELGYQPLRALDGSQERAARASGCDQELAPMGGGAIVELHWAVVPRYFSFELPVAELMSRAEPVRIADFVARTPCLDDVALLLAMNGAKDAWSRLEPVCTLARLMLGAHLDWNAIAARARRLGARRITGVALALVRDVLSLPVPEEALPLVGVDPGSSSALALAKERLYDPSPRPMGDVARMLRQLRFRERWADRARHAILRVSVPTIEDCATLPVPAPIWFASAAVRPFRLAARWMRAS